MAVILQFPTPEATPEPEEPTFREKVFALRVRLACANYGHRFGDNPTRALLEPSDTCFDCGAKR